MRRRLAPVLLTLAAATLPVASRAQEPASSQLTLLDAVDRAIRQHPHVRAAEATRDQAALAATGVSAARLPSLALTMSATRYEHPMLVTPIHGFTAGEAPPFDETLVQGAVAMSYTLFDGGARTARTRQAQEQAAAADAASNGSEQAITARVVTAYVQVLARHAVVDAHDRRLAALEAELSRARLREAVGRAPQVEVLRAEAALASAAAERVRFAEALSLAERDLARLTGVPQEATSASRLVPVRRSDAPLPPRAELLAAAREGSPAMARARRQVAAAGAAVDEAKGAWWPELKLGAAYIQRGSAATRSFGEWSAGTTLSFPLYTGGATGAGVERSRAGQRESQELLRLTELQLAEEVDRACTAVAEARAREASLTSAVARYAEVARIEKLALDAGTGTQTDYLAAEADLLAARASLAEAVMHGVAARTELARVTGQLSPTWLQRELEATR